MNEGSLEWKREKNEWMKGLRVKIEGWKEGMKGREERMNWWIKEGRKEREKRMNEWRLGMIKEGGNGMKEKEERMNEWRELGMKKEGRKEWREEMKEWIDELRKEEM